MVKACLKKIVCLNYVSQNRTKMTTEEAKKIRIADYLHSLGYSPVKQQGVNLWYKSPFREENEPSFKVNTEREQ